MRITIAKPLLAILLAASLSGCDTEQTIARLDPSQGIAPLETRALARYERIQREVDAYFACGERQAFGMATTAIRPRDIATAAKNGCGRKRNRMLWRMQRCYPSPIWSRLTIDIDQTFRERAIAVVFDRRAYLRAHGQWVGTP